MSGLGNRKKRAASYGTGKNRGGTSCLRRKKRADRHSRGETEQGLHTTIQNSLVHRLSPGGAGMAEEKSMDRTLGLPSVCEEEGDKPTRSTES